MQVGGDLALELDRAAQLDLLADDGVERRRCSRSRSCRRPASRPAGTSTSVASDLTKWATMSLASVWNCSFLATKSVSQASSIMAFSAAAIRPLLVSRSAPRLAALPAPLMRSSSTALSKSPSAASRAFFASIIPAPVASRSFFTSAAVTAMTAMSFSRDLGFSVRGVCGAGMEVDVRQSMPAPGRPRAGAGQEAASRRSRRPARLRPRSPAASAAAAGGRSLSGAARRPALRPERCRLAASAGASAGVASAAGAAQRSSAGASRRPAASAVSVGLSSSVSQSASGSSVPS